MNFEVSLVSLDAGLAAVLAAQFDGDLSLATRIDPLGWPDRPVSQQLSEAAANLLAPVL